MSVLRVLLAFLLMSAGIAIGTAVVAFFCIGIGYLLTRVVPFSLFQASFFGLASAAAFLFSASRIWDALISVLGRASAPAVGAAAKEAPEQEEDAEVEPAPSPTRVILTTDVGDVVLRPGPPPVEGQRWRKRARRS